MTATFWFSDYGTCSSVLRARLDDAAPSRIQVLTGPRQVGKTTLLLEIAEEHGASSLYAACDGPEAAVPGFWERLWARAAEAARDRTVTLLLDEVHHVGDWSGRLKGEWDRVRRRRLPVHVVATGSSALRLGTGSRESLAGRFERLVLTHWSASSISAAFGWPGKEAAEATVLWGTYPGAVGLIDDPTRWSAYVRDAIVEPAIGRDVLALGQIRKPALLRQVFAACVVSPAQIVSLQKLQGRLQDRGALETIAHYLTLLEEAYLVAALEKYSTRPLRRRRAPPKIVVLSNALMAATDPRGIPDADAEPDRYGTWVENACLAFAWNSGQRVSYWREEPLEVDAIVEGSWGKWAIEVKTGPFATLDLAGLLEFTKRHRSFRPLVLCRQEDVESATRTGVEATPWKRFLLEGPPRE